MTYLHALLACQNRDYEKFKRLLHKDVELKAVFYDGSEFKGTVDEGLELIRETIEKENHWDFEVITRLNRRNEEIVFLNVTRAEKHTNYKINAVIIILCDTSKSEGYIRKLHLEVGEYST
ncbi:hypothetical protein [Macrococcus lamae]|uniref:Nuclear transport factor 2 family protein n=1 Tax=Macrococcus lamae TaxID=198484 RepID=A0A4R6BTF7_9STAP|nr:hypothetical protein [Macrococcus lamae]TDM07706.1 hypothetical protein ERX29_08160 [Macrococcus lamae]